MKEKILIVEDQFVEADYLRLMLTQAGYVVTGVAHSVLQAQEMIKDQRPDFVLLDIFLKGKMTGIDLGRYLGRENIAFVYLSANSNEEVLSEAKATQPYGFLVKPFRQRDLLAMLEIARYRHEHSMETYFRREKQLRERLIAITAGADSWENKLLNICKALQPYICFDYVTIGFNTIGTMPFQGLSFLRIGYDEYQKVGVPELLTITRLSEGELIKLARNTTYDNTVTLSIEEAFEQLSRKPSLNRLFAETFQIRSYINLPLYLSSDEIFSFCFYSRKSGSYTTDHIGLLQSLQERISSGIESMLFAERRNTAHGSKRDNHPKFMEAPGFEGIIGSSHLLLNVFDLIAQVAPSDTSVLILGESGTGKERIADCIHNLSARKGGPFVKVNCAALPPTLIESELFGHEKGAFTGALDRRIGKFEKADKGTIFLDEIGELPVELQAKLLRVLQEKYIERIGSRDATRADVRVIAATNRNLEKEVAEGRFRLDLYYRLNVFPIALPPLRERTEDIPALADHFIKYYNRKAGKKISAVSEKALKAMTAYPWPGNIRELENIIERSVLLSKGTMIEEVSLPVAKIKEVSPGASDFRMQTMDEHEREYIIAVLRKCKGKVWGAGGAAEILNLPPTTLKSRMKKLGIRKEII